MGTQEVITRPAAGRYGCGVVVLVVVSVFIGECHYFHLQLKA